MEDRHEEILELQQQMEKLGSRLKEKFGDQVHLDGEDSEEDGDEIQYADA
jgi:hypothetical protein